MNNFDKGNISLPPEVDEAFKQESSQLQQEIGQVWALIDQTGESHIATPKEELENRWQQLSMRVAQTDSVVDSVPERVQPKFTPIFSLRRGWVRAAAAAVALLIGAFGFWSQSITVSADFGETAQVVLPDGSTVQLNSGSTLRYARGFDGIPFVEAKLRDVHLEGEAFFDIQKSTTPFRVTTFNAEVHVLGTTFNVRAHTEDSDGSTTVVLATGHVAVNALASTDKQVFLDEAGETARVLNQAETPAEVTKTNLQQVLIWRENGFAVSNEPLQLVFAELERRFDVSIYIDDPEILKDSLNILFARPKNIESILDDICSSKSLKYRETSRGYLIFRPDEM